MIVSDCVSHSYLRACASETRFGKQAREAHTESLAAAVRAAQESACNDFGELFAKSSSVSLRRTYVGLAALAGCDIFRGHHGVSVTVNRCK